MDLESALGLSPSFLLFGGSPMEVAGTWKAGWQAPHTVPGVVPSSTLSWPTRPLDPSKRVCTVHLWPIPSAFLMDQRQPSFPPFLFSLLQKPEWKEM